MKIFNTTIPLLGIIVLLTTLLTIMHCSGLVKLKIPPEAYNEGEEKWITPYGNNLRHNSTEVDVLPPYKILWDKKYKSVIPDQPLAIDNYIIFVIQNGMLAFFDINRGELIGDGRIAPGFKHSPLIDQNFLYYAANLGYETLGAIKLDKFKKKWKVKLPHLNTTPLLWEDKLYVGSDFGQFFCLEKNSGEMKWQIQAEGGIYGLPAELNGLIFFADVKGNVYSIDGNTGEIKWKEALKGNIYSGPLVAENHIFIGSTAGTLSSLEAETGKINWSIETGKSIYGNACYKDNTLYFGNNGHFVYAIDAQNGNIIWRFETMGINNSTPLAGNDFLYFCSWDRAFYVLDRESGQLIYRQEFNRPFKTSPLIYKDRIFIQTANDHFYCLANENFNTHQEH